MPTLTVPEEEWAEVVDRKPIGTLRACQVFGTHVLERGYGLIVNLASLNRLVAFNVVAAYAAGKQPLFRSRARLPWRGQRRELR